MHVTSSRKIELLDRRPKARPPCAMTIGLEIQSWAEHFCSRLLQVEMHQEDPHLWFHFLAFKEQQQQHQKKPAVLLLLLPLTLRPFFKYTFLLLLLRRSRGNEAADVGNIIKCSYYMYENWNMVAYSRQTPEEQQQKIEWKAFWGVLASLHEQVLLWRNWTPLGTQQQTQWQMDWAFTLHSCPEYDSFRIYVLQWQAKVNGLLTFDCCEKAAEILLHVCFKIAVDSTQPLLDSEKVPPIFY